MLTQLTESEYYRDDPLVVINGGISRSFTGYEQYIPDFIEKGKSIEKISEEKSLFEISHDDIMETNSSEIRLDVIYVDMTMWDRISTSTNTEVVLYNFDTYSEDTNFSYYSDFEERQFNYHPDMVEMPNTIPSLVFGYRGGFNSYLSYVILPITSLETENYSSVIPEELHLDPSWHMEFFLLPEFSEIEQYDTINQLERFTVSVENTISDSWEQNFGDTYRTYTPLLENTYHIQRQGQFKVEYILNTFAPLLLLFQFAILYYLYSVIISKREQLDLLYTRGESVFDLSLSFINWSTITPTVVSVVAVLPPVWLFADQVVLTNSLPLILTWLSLQLPVVLYLSLREIRYLRIRMITHRNTELPELPLKWWMVSLLVTLYYIIKTITWLRTYTQEPLEGDVSVLFRLPLYYTTASIALVFILFTLFFYKLETAMISESSRFFSNFPLKMMQDRKLVAVLVIGLTFIAMNHFVGMVHYSDTFESRHETKRDFTISFDVSGSEMAHELVSNASRMNQFSALGSFVPNVHYSGSLSSKQPAFNFSTVHFNIINQTLYDNYAKSYDREPKDLRDQIWLDEQLGTYIDQHNVTLHLNSIPIPQNHVVTLDEPLVIDPERENYLFSNLKTWAALGLDIPEFSHRNYGELDIYLNTNSSVTEELIENYVMDTFDISTESFRVNQNRDRDESGSVWPDTVFDDPLVQLSMYALVVAVLITVIWLANSGLLRDLGLLQTRYGSYPRKEVQRRQFLLSLVPVVLGMIGGIVTGFTDNLRTSGLFSIHGLRLQQPYDFVSLILGSFLYLGLVSILLGVFYWFWGVRR